MNDFHQNPARAPVSYLKRKFRVSYHPTLRYFTYRQTNFQKLFPVQNRLSPFSLKIKSYPKSLCPKSLFPRFIQKICQTDFRSAELDHKFWSYCFRNTKTDRLLPPSKLEFKQILSQRAYPAQEESACKISASQVVWFWRYSCQRTHTDFRLAELALKLIQICICGAKSIYKILLPYQHVSFLR